MFKKLLKLPTISEQRAANCKVVLPKLRNFKMDIENREEITKLRHLRGKIRYHYRILDGKIPLRLSIFA